MKSIPDKILLDRANSETHSHLLSLVILVAAVMLSLASLPNFGGTAFERDDPFYDNCSGNPPEDINYTVNVMVVDNNGNGIAGSMVKLNYNFFSETNNNGPCKVRVIQSGSVTQPTDSVGKVQIITPSFTWDNTLDKLNYSVEALKVDFTVDRQNRLIYYYGRSESTDNITLDLFPIDWSK